MFLESPFYWKQLEDGTRGGAQPNVNGQTLGKLIVAIPPLAEQHRIVAKVDELMALCDRLEAAQAERERRRDRLVAASLNRLNRPDDDPKAFRAHARLHLCHLPRFTVRPDQIPALRQTILNLAVRGRLVPQAPDEEPIADVVVESSSHHIGPIGDSEIPFDVPESWRWRRLGSEAVLINGDRSRSYPNKSEYVSSGLPFINTGHIQPNGSLSLGSMHYLTRRRYDSLRSGKIKPGDLVYCLRGATLGKTAFVVPFDEGAIASSLVIIRLSTAICGRFLFYTLTSPFGKELTRRFDNGSAQPNLSANSVKQYVIPLPPMPEQRRIVAKMDELMAVCDRLERNSPRPRPKAAVCWKRYSVNRLPPI